MYSLKEKFLRQAHSFIMHAYVIERDSAAGDDKAINVISLKLIPSLAACEICNYSLALTYYITNFIKALHPSLITSNRKRVTIKIFIM